LYLDSTGVYPGTDNTWYDINGYNAGYADFSTILPSTYINFPSQTSQQLWYYKVSAQKYWLAFIPENSALLAQDHDCYLPGGYYCITQ
jgi:hypothetical protein